MVQGPVLVHNWQNQTLTSCCHGTSPLEVINRNDL